MWKTILAAALVAALAGGIWLYRATRPAAPVAAEGGAPLVAVTVPELAAVEQEGKAAFDRFCASCHGENAAGQDGVAPPLVHRIYEPSHHGDMAFVLAARQGVRGHHWRFGDMAAVEGVSDAELALIIGYVRALQRANGIR